MEHKPFQKMSLSDQAWWLVFAGWLFFKVLAFANIFFLGRPLESIGWRVDLAAAAVMTGLLFFCGYRKSELTVCLILTFLFGIASYTAGDWTLVTQFLVIAAARRQKLDSILKFGLSLFLVITSVVVALYLVGVIPDVNANRIDTIRYSLGFTHPNAAGICVLQILALWFYKRGLHPRPIDFAAALALAVFIYLVPNSNTTFICIFLLTAAALWTVLSPRLPEFLRKAARIAMVAAIAVCNLFSVAATLLFKPEGFFLTLNSFLNIRLSEGMKMFSASGIHLFGSPIPMVDDAFVILDNSYVNLLLHFGLLAWLLYSAMLIISAVRIAKLKNDVLLGILTVFCFHGIMERSLLEVRCCLFLPILLCALCKESPMYHSLTPRKS